MSDAGVNGAQVDAILALSRMDLELSGSNGRAQMAQVFLLKLAFEG